MGPRGSSKATLLLPLWLFGTVSVFPQNNKVPTPQVPELRTDVRLVVLDVLVTDSHGKTVPGLKIDDFNLSENGTTQTLKSFEDHSSLLAGSAGTSQSVPETSLPAGTYSNRPKFQSNLWNVIVVDMLNTAAQDQTLARQALRAFASQLPSGVPVALLVMSSSSVRMLVPFTPSGEAISKLLAGDALFSVHSPLLDTYNADDEAQLEQALSVAKVPENIKESYRETEMDRLQMRVQQTLSSLDALATWLGRLPGKKNLYWLSAGFPLSAEPQTMRNGVDDRASEKWLQTYSLLQHETDTRLEAARVAVFPLDVRGNYSLPGIDTADVQGTLYAKPGGAVRYSDDVNQATQRINSEHAEMEEIAEQTGGVAHYNRNDLAQQLSDQFNQAQAYYTISYSPTDKNWNGKYRKISLKLKDRSYKLYYRRGYFADAPSPTPTNPADAFTLAMRHGAVPSSSILFKVRLDSDTPGKLILHYTVDPQTIRLIDAPDNRKSAKINCAVVEYDEAGTVLGTTTIQVAASVRPDQMPLLESAGFPATQQVPLLPNAESLAIGIQDANTGSFGTLQIAVKSPTASRAQVPAELK